MTGPAAACHPRTRAMPLSPASGPSSSSSASQCPWELAAQASMVEVADSAVAACSLWRARTAASRRGQAVSAGLPEAGTLRAGLLQGHAHTAEHRPLHPPALALVQGLGELAAAARAKVVSLSWEPTEQARPSASAALMHSLRARVGHGVGPGSQGPATTGCGWLVPRGPVCTQRGGPARHAQRRSLHCRSPLAPGLGGGARRRRAVLLRFRPQLRGALLASSSRRGLGGAAGRGDRRGGEGALHHCVRGRGACGAHALCWPGPGRAGRAQVGRTGCQLRQSSSCRVAGPARAQRSHNAPSCRWQLKGALRAAVQQRGRAGRRFPVGAQQRALGRLRGPGSSGALVQGSDRLGRGEKWTGEGWVGRLVIGGSAGTKSPACTS